MTRRAASVEEEEPMSEWITMARLLDESWIPANPREPRSLRTPPSSGCILCDGLGHDASCRCCCHGVRLEVLTDESVLRSG